MIGAGACCVDEEDVSPSRLLSRLLCLCRMANLFSDDAEADELEDLLSRRRAPADTVRTIFFLTRVDASRASRFGTVMSLTICVSVADVLTQFHTAVSLLNCRHRTHGGGLNINGLSSSGILAYCCCAVFI